MNKKELLKKVSKKLKISLIVQRNFSMARDIKPIYNKDIGDIKEYSQKSYGDNAPQFILWAIDIYDKDELPIVRDFLKKNIESIKKWKGEQFIKNLIKDPRKRNNIGLTA